jgi:hypothetical protein
LVAVARLVFAVLHVRPAQQQRSRVSGFRLARSFATFELIKARRLMMSLPDGVPKQALTGQRGDQEELLWV